MAMASVNNHRPLSRILLRLHHRWPPQHSAASASFHIRHAVSGASAASSSPFRGGVSVGRKSGGRRFVGLTLAQGTEQEDSSSVGEELEPTSSLQHEDISIHGEETNETTSRKRNDMLADKSSSLRNVALWVSAAVSFGVALGFKDGLEKASEFFAGYLLEQSLSVDNLFVFVLIFKYFKVPKPYQSRVLSYGIGGAIIFRATMILLGTATLQRFEAVNLLLASILLFSSYKLFFADEEEADLSDNFIVKSCQKFIPVTDYYDGDRFLTMVDGVWQATPLLLTVAVIELSDIAFAVDSIPAVFGVTRDPLIVFSSNMFAVTGLRSLYVLVSESMSELEYLQPAIGIVLAFIGTKMVFDVFGYHVPTGISLAFVATTLSAGVFLSLGNKQD